MKRFCAIVLSAVLALPPSAVFAYDHPTAFVNSAVFDEAKVNMTALEDDVVQFSAEDLERRLALDSGELRGVTVTRLPVDGVLYMRDTPVDAYTYIPREKLDELWLQPASASASNVSIGMLPLAEESKATTVTVSYSQTVNNPPILKEASFSTIEGVPFAGWIYVYDAEGDDVTLVLRTKPAKGTISFNGKGFIYEPYPGAEGVDTFALCAVDAFDNYSQEMTYTVSIQKGVVSPTYVDMDTSPSQYAAAMLTHHGVVQGEKIGSQWFFNPYRKVTSGEFLVMLITAIGEDQDLPTVVSTPLENDRTVPQWMKPYIKKALDLGIIAETFDVDTIPTRAEAVVMVDKASKIPEVNRFNLLLSDIGDIPTWAMSSYMKLGAYAMLDIYDGQAHPHYTLDRSYAADLVWQLYRHANKLS